MTQDKKELVLFWSIIFIWVLFSLLFSLFFFSLFKGWQPYPDTKEVVKEVGAVLDTK